MVKSKSGLTTYDSIFRENFILELLDVFKIILGIEAFEIDPENPLSSAKIARTLEREPDFVRVMRSQEDEKFILHIEFQTKDDQHMLLRMQEYHALLQRKVNLPIRHFVIYLGNKKSKMKSEMPIDQIFSGFELKDLTNYEASSLLNSSIPEEVILAVLANNHTKDPAQTIRQILDRLSALSNDEAKLQKYIYQLTVLSRLRNLQEETIKQTKAMPLTIDIDNDILYKEGLETGMMNALERTVLAMTKEGESLVKIKRFTELDSSAIYAIIEKHKLK